MQFFTTVATLAVAVVGSVSAMPSPPPRAGDCSTGAVRCCDNAEPASSDKSQIILEALGLYSPDTPTDGSIGLSCSPVASPVGDSQSCDATPMCCSGDDFGSLSIGCSPLGLKI
ncbi:hypothetical protein C8Q74DRAFT_1363559 [Fomes fomentarius]|nr:hypothetical protein C8Q74DRAFT_1363559 [Fomes fomentarius]